jgi:hypothetical protein
MFTTRTVRAALATALFAALAVAAGAAAPLGAQRISLASPRAVHDTITLAPGDSAQLVPALRNSLNRSTALTASTKLQWDAKCSCGVLLNRDTRWLRVGVAGSGRVIVRWLHSNGHVYADTLQLAVRALEAPPVVVQPPTQPPLPPYYALAVFDTGMVNRLGGPQFAAACSARVWGDVRVSNDTVEVMPGTGQPYVSTPPDGATTYCVPNDAWVVYRFVPLPGKPGCARDYVHPPLTTRPGRVADNQGGVDSPLVQGTPALCEAPDAVPDAATAPAGGA